MAPSTQTKVLRALESGEVMRLGSSSTRKVDVRFLSAANRDLRKLVASGGFRADLFFRLNGITMTLPPLRNRPDDVLPLAEVFLERAARKLRKPPPGLGDEAREALARHPWPGNVRELRNVIERAVVLCRGEVLKLEHLLLQESELEPFTVPPPATTPLASPPADEPVTLRAPAAAAGPRAQGEGRGVRRARDPGGPGEDRRKSDPGGEAAGTARRTLIEKIIRHGIERPRADTGRDAPNGTSH